MTDTYQYQLMPALTAEEYQSLKDDIKARGVQVPVEYDEQGNILDGHHRVQVCHELGITTWPRVVRIGMSEDQKREHVLALNLNRRHLTREQRADLVGKLRAQGWSLRRIAERLHTGVNQVQSDLDVYPVDTPDHISGADGKSYPTRRTVPLWNPRPEDERTIRENPAIVDKLVSGEAASLQHARALTRIETRKEIPIPTDKYTVFYVDPPWEYGQVIEKYGPAERHYETMSLDKLITDVPVPTLSDNNAVLFLWATSPKLAEAMSLLDAWGFAYKASFIWDKIRHNFGHYNSVRHELLLIATKGSYPPETPRLVDSVVSIERTEHSVKPAYFRELIEAMYPNGKRIELFARGVQPDGWNTWGYESEHKDDAV